MLNSLYALVLTDSLHLSTILVKLRMYTRSFMIMVMATALKSLPGAAQCGKPKPTAKLTLKMNTSAP